MTLVYCVAAPDERTYEAAQAAHDRFWKGNYGSGNTEVRNKYPCTGWTMDELIGSQWVGIHTADMKTISHIVTNRWGNPELMPESALVRDYGLGFWYNERYVIEHYIRYDVLTLAEQLTWKAGLVAYSQSEVDRANRDYQEHRTDPLNANYKKHWLRVQREELQQALDDLQAFCTQHGFAPGAEYVNAGINQSAEPMQMRLFI